VLGASGRHVKDRGRRPGTVFGWSVPFQKELVLEHHDPGSPPTESRMLGAGERQGLSEQAGMGRPVNVNDHTPSRTWFPNGRHARLDRGSFAVRAAPSALEYAYT
jgi:hypothetical protein